MTPEQFCYWLQCLAEIQDNTPTDKQWQIVKDHLATVFKKETPNRLAQDATMLVRRPLISDDLNIKIC